MVAVFAVVLWVILFVGSTYITEVLVEYKFMEIWSHKLLDKEEPHYEYTKIFKE